MELSDEIHRILATAEGNPPPNEAATCLWVIVPLLEAAGYSKTEIVPVAQDAGGQYPDYTILPSNEATWYLEAKSWTLNLNDQHATQSLNYANQNGRRWVVLTNGREWRLYDNTVLGTATDKLVCSVQSSSGNEFARFLEAISRESAVSGGIDQYAVDHRLATVLTEELQQPGSALTRALLNVLRRRNGLSRVTAERVVEFFRRREETPDASETETSDGMSAQGTTPQDPPAGALSLASLKELLMTEPQSLAKTKPSAVGEVGSAPRPVTSWKEAQIRLSEMVLVKGATPDLPFPAGQNCLINRGPFLESGKRMHQFGQITVRGETIYVHTLNSASQKVSLLYKLCTAAGVDPADLYICVTPYTNEAA